MLSAEARRRWPFAGNTRHRPIWIRSVIIPRFFRPLSGHFYPAPSATRARRNPPPRSEQTITNPYRPVSDLSFGDLSGSHAPRRAVGSGNMSGSSVLRYCVIRSRGWMLTNPLINLRVAVGPGHVLRWGALGKGATRTFGKGLSSEMSV